MTLETKLDNPKKIGDSSKILAKKTNSLLSFRKIPAPPSRTNEELKNRLPPPKKYRQQEKESVSSKNFFACSLDTAAFSKKKKKGMSALTDMMDRDII